MGVLGGVVHDQCDAVSLWCWPSEIYKTWVGCNSHAFVQLSLNHNYHVQHIRKET